MKKIVVLANSDLIIFKFRKELMAELQKNGYSIYIIAPDGQYTEKLLNMGLYCKNVPTDRRGINPLKDIKTIFNYYILIKKIKPDVVLTYTIKPNIYGSLLCNFMTVPHIVNITGLGTALENQGVLCDFLKKLYQFSLKKVDYIFFQNRRNLDFFSNLCVDSNKFVLTPGSGVNIDEFQYVPYPPDSRLEFIYSARIMNDKGINEFLYAAKILNKKYMNLKFHVCGFCEEEYQEILKQYELDGIFRYHGQVSDIKEILKNMHCMVLPSYHEGMSNTLLEAAAMGRPLIASDIAGCREAVDNNISGFLFKAKDSSDLVAAMEKFIQLPYDMKIAMGIAGRQKMETQFDRKIVTQIYIDKIEETLKQWGNRHGNIRGNH